MKSKFHYDISYTQNRELSWLTFNKRVLEEAKGKEVPLYERLKFVSIFTSNLDEFFMIRVGSLYDISIINSNHRDNKSGMTANEQLKTIFHNVLPLYKEKDEIFQSIQKELKEYQIFKEVINNLDKKDKAFVDNYFNDYVLPVLSPQIIDNLHPFPHLQNLSLNVVGLIKNNGRNLVGIIPIPSTLPRIIFLQGEGLRYILMEEIILEYMDVVFEKNQILSKSLVRVTRNADISPDDESKYIDDDYRLYMKKILKKRGRLSPVRLEVYDKIKPELQDYLVNRLKINKDQVFKSMSPLDMSYVFKILDKVPLNKKRKITYSDVKPQIHYGISKYENMIEEALKGDILLSYPYEKMDAFLRLIKDAANDPDVVSIKITIYRLARKAKLIEYLTTAAENNKEVTVLMELKARFDEENNINWSETLEEAGCNILYGFEDFKVHSKVCLITRKTNNTINYITQVGTGNYNENTAKLYTDLSLITANKNIGEDVANFFKNMSIANLDGHYEHLLVAPSSMKNKIINLIDEEIEKSKNGEEGQILIKINSLTDRELIDKLKEASVNGVKVKMIIRGICCILPGIENKTENIEVHSIVGRFLEHSRVYCFGTGDSMKMYISSADFMTRNMEKRVEVACPVYDPKIKETILNMLDIMLKDNEKGRLIDSNGKYIKIKKQCLESINSQEYFIEEAYKKAIKQVTIDEKNKDKIIEKKELQSIYKEKEELLKIKEEIQYSTRLLKEEIDRLKEVQNEVIKLHNLEAAATSTDK